MPAYPVDPRTLHWNSPRGGGSFRPNGKLTPHGIHRNPEKWFSKRTLSGRLLVGLSVGETPTYSVEHVVALVKEIRQRQVGDPSSSFVSQKGVYRHKDGSGRVVEEDGVQVFVIDMNGATDDEFHQQMVEMGEELCRRLQQEEVVVEIQVNGLSQFTMGVSA